MKRDTSSAHTLRNPYSGMTDYYCFGCSPDNPIGLKLSFSLADEVVYSTWHPRVEFEGYPGVIHGGIQVTLADETAAWYIHAVLGTAGMTRGLSATYHEPAKRDDAPFSIAARGVSVSGRHATIEVTIHGNSGTRFTTVRCEYGVFSEAVARKRLGFPGAQAFFSDD